MNVPRGLIGRHLPQAKHRDLKEEDLALNFHDALAEQRWDDHRYYHHSRINQSLHLLSALSFLCAYAAARSWTRRLRR